MKKEKFTIKQFDDRYPDDEACLEEIFVNRYGHLENCPSCEAKFSFYKVSDRKCYACAYCSYQIHPLAKTIFHKSPTPLKSWFFAIFLFAASKNGVSAMELHRQIGVTYKCAYRMAQQIRKLFEENVDKLNNEVEIDETYYGGKESNKHAHKRTPHTQGRSIKTKTPVLAAVEREGKIIAKVVRNTSSATIQPFLKKHVSIEAEVKTDEYRGYSNLTKIGYKHDTVDHGRKQFVKGRAHTNNLEGFWSQLKRSINGTYHFVSPKHLQAYVNEFAYRYNRRNQINPLFDTFIAQVWKLS